MRPPNGAAQRSCWPSTFDWRNRATGRSSRATTGMSTEALADAHSTVEATYTLPYLTHAPMEPNNSACRMRDDGVLEVWVAHRVA